jgi:chaperone required for assembly of F1-ATPase
VRRKYLNCGVVQTPQGFAPALDGKPMRTPAGNPFAVGNRNLAEAITAEWNAVPDNEEINPKWMPLTRLAATGIDRVATQRAAVLAEIAGYARTDLLCYRAERPGELVARQNAGWDPWLAWAEARFGAQLQSTQGVMPIRQDETAIERLQDALAGFDDFAVAGLFNLTAMLGSLVLALAVLQGELEIERAIALAEIDAVFQAERWGEDSEALRRREGVRRDIADVGRFLTLLSPSEL